MMSDYMQEKLQASFVEIELFQDTPFIAGQPMYGTIHVQAEKEINNLA